MTSSSNTQTDMNLNDQMDNLNQNENKNSYQNVEQQNSGLNTRTTSNTLSPTPHITSNTYVFTTPIKLTRNNFMLWRSQVISSIRTNELKGFIDGSNVCPPRVFVNPRPNQTTITTPNP